MPAVVQYDIPGVGHVYSPDGPGPFAAILLLHGSEGALGWLSHREAALFAACGFLALPFAYSVGGNYWIGGDIWNVNLDTTEEVLVGLGAHERCTGKVGLYGWSRGAEHALLATALMAQEGSAHQPAAVAAHAPPDKVVGAWRNLFYRHREQGDLIEPPPVWGFRTERLIPGVPDWTWRGAPVAEDSPIPIEAYEGPIFLSVGDQDEIWSADMAPRLAERLRSAGRDPELHVYEGQLHMPDPSAWNAHLDLLLGFFRRTLAA